MFAIGPNGKRASLWVDAEGKLITTSDPEDTAALPAGARIAQALRVNAQGALLASGGGGSGGFNPLTNGARYWGVKLLAPGQSGFSGLADITLAVGSGASIQPRTHTDANKLLAYGRQGAYSNAAANSFCAPVPTNSWLVPNARVTAGVTNTDHGDGPMLIYDFGTPFRPDTLRLGPPIAGRIPQQAPRISLVAGNAIFQLTESPSLLLSNIPWDTATVRTYSVAAIFNGALVNGGTGV